MRKTFDRMPVIIGRKMWIIPAVEIQVQVRKTLEKLSGMKMYQNLQEKRHWASMMSFSLLLRKMQTRRKAFQKNG